MGKARGQRRTLLKEIEARDRELARDMREANVRTMRAVNATARAMHGERRAGARIERLLSTAWRRPPKKALRKRITTKIAGGRVAARRRTGTGRAASTVHFKLGLTHSGRAGAAHQRYIERDGAAIASFGNISDDARERARVWEAIEERTRKRKGVLKATKDAPEGLKRAIVEQMDTFVAEGRIPEKAAAALRRKAREEDGLKDVEIGLATTDKADHQQLLETMWALGAESAKERAARHERNTKERPAGVHAYEPRAGIVQRRLVLELPHEITHEQMERCLRRWCRRHLDNEGVGYHAAIHQPEAGNDRRNWHAHVVFAQFATPRRRDDTGFALEDGRALPKLAPVMQRLSGNTADKRKGVKALIKAWRRSWCEVLNEALDAGGHAKRYDARSYADQGINREAGQHLGPERTRLEETAPEGGRHWERDAPEWTSITTAWSEQVRALGGDDAMVDAHVAHLERIRLMSGLAAQGVAHDDPIARRLAQELDPQRIAGESSALASLEDALEETTRGLEPAWLNEWRRTESEGLGRDARGRAASEIGRKAGGLKVIERWSGSAVGAAAGDLLAAARSHESGLGQWRRRAAAALAESGDEEERDRRANALENTAAEVGRRLDALLEPAEIAEIEERSARQRRRESARRAREEATAMLAASSSPEEVARGAAELVGEHAEYWTRDAPEEGAALRRWTEAAQGAARLRSDFRRACEARTTGRVLEMAARLGATDPRTKAAVTMLSEAEIAHMQSSARSEEETQREQRRIERRARQMMAQLVDEAGRPREGAGATIVACWEDEALKSDLAKGAPEGLAYVARAFREIEQRRVTVRERLARMGESREAAAIVWTADPECLTLCASAREREAIGEKAKQWAEETAQAVLPRPSEAAPAHQRRIASMLTPQAHEALKVLAAQSARTIEAARTKEARDTEATRAQAQTLEELMVGKSPTERRRGYAGVDALLADPIERARLGSEETERLERRRRHLPGPERER